MPSALNPGYVNIPIPHAGSTLGKRLRKAVLQPYKIPGFLRRQYERNFHTVVGSQVIWPAPGQALLVNLAMPRPQQHQVLVLTHASLISPGTERAFFNRVPNTVVGYPYQPGYSGAGTIVEIGSQVTRFGVGERVAGEFPHASIVLVEENKLIPVPNALSLEQASFVWLGVIATQGVRKAHIRLGERVAVLGQGLIGQLVTQLAALAGAYPVTAIAVSRDHLPLSLQNGAHNTISIMQDAELLDKVAADVTIEVSGSPEAIHTAIRCTRPGGRIILLGSTRGITRAFDLELVNAKKLTLVGAHLASLPESQSLPGWWTPEKEAGFFFDLIAQKRIKVDSLTSDEIYPSEAERFYRRLAWGDKSIIAGLFRWDWLPERERLDGLLGEAISKGQFSRLVRDRTLRLVDRSKANQMSRLPAKPLGAETNMGKTNLDRLRIGLIGCGEIAVSNASAVYAASNATITAVTDVNQAVARDLAGRYQVPVTKTVEEMLARDDVDAVLISVPHFLHAPLAIQAARAGKHVIVEKPMATTLAEADEMLAVARETGTHLATLYCQRYLPYAQRAKTLIDQGALGKVLGASFQIYNDKPTSYYTSGFSGRVATDWRLSKEKSGGGVLIFNAVHYLDMFRYLTGLEVTRAYGDCGALDTPLETEDTVSATLHYDNQTIASLTASSVVRGSLVYAFTQLRIWGTDGHIILTEPDNHIFYTLRQIKGYKVGEWQSLGQLPPEQDRQEFITKFASAILDGKTPEMTAESGRAIQAIVEAVYRSSQIQRPVNLESLNAREEVSNPLAPSQGE